LGYIGMPILGYTLLISNHRLTAMVPKIALIMHNRPNNPMHYAICKI
jgi:hypothetical protein